METVGPYLLLPFIAFMLIGVPIAFALAVSVLVFVFFSGTPIRSVVVLTEMYDGIASVSLLALPLFILTGEILNRSDITQKLVTLAARMVGWMIGGLGHVTVVASMFFAGISGSAIADAAALGPLMIPGMVREKFPAAFAAALTAAAAVIGPIIPPSIPAIIIGAQLGISIGGLFAAGIIPGIIIGLGLMAANYTVARRRGYGEVHPFEGWRSLGSATVDALPALMVPVLLLGGILSGVFTPTEAGAVSALYAALVGAFFYRSLGVTKLRSALVATARVTGSVLLIYAAAVIFSRILTVQRIPQELLQVFLALTQNKVLLVLLVIVLFLIVGMFMDAAVNMVILGPLLMPTLVQGAGMHPIQFGMFLMVGLLIGLLTPPVGLCLFITAPIARVSLGAVSVACLPFIAVETAVLLLIAFVPEVSLFIPRLLGFV